MAILNAKFRKAERKEEASANEQRFVSLPVVNFRHSDAFRIPYGKAKTKKILKTAALRCVST